MADVPVTIQKTVGILLSLPAKVSVILTTGDRVGFIVTDVSEGGLIGRPRNGPSDARAFIPHTGYCMLEVH